MSRFTRRSASQQINRQSFGNENILNFSSDVNSERNSWWKNLSDNDRRRLLINSKINPNTFNRLNSDSNVSENEDPEWWRNISGNVPLPVKLKNVIEKEDNDNENIFEKQASQLETDESGNENILPKKSIFASQEVRSQRSRYSHAFNVPKTEKTTHQDLISEQDAEIEDINAIEEEPKEEISENKETKKNKKRCRTKKLFSKKIKKRKYSDIFSAPNTEFEADQETKLEKDVTVNDNIDIRTSKIEVEKQDSVTKNVSKEIIEVKKDLFKLNEKKNSKAFRKNLNYESEENVEKTDKDVTLQKDTITDNVSKGSVEVKKDLFKINQKKKKYSEAFLNELNNESPEKEDEKSNKDSVFQTEDTIADNISKDTVEMKKELFKVNQKKKKYSQAFSLSKKNKSVEKVDKNEDTDIEIIQKEDTYVDIIQKEDSDVDNVSRKVAKEKKELFQVNLKKKKYSEAFAISTHKNLTDSETSEEVLIPKDKSLASNRSFKTRKSNSSKVNEKTPSNFTPARNRSLRTRKSNSSKGNEQTQSDSIPVRNRSLRTKKSNSSKGNEQTQSDSTPARNRSFKARKSTSSKVNEKTQNDSTPANNRSLRIRKSNSSEVVNLKNKCSEAFAISIYKNLIDSETSEEEIFREEILTQKDTSLASNRSLRTRKSNLSEVVEKTPQKNTSLKVKESNISDSKNKKNISYRSNKETLDSLKKDINIRNKTPQSELLNLNKRTSKIIQDSSKDKESIEVEETVLGEEFQTPKSLFPKNKKSKKYSEAFLIANEKSQNHTENIKHNEEQVSTEKDTKKYQTKSLTVQEILSKRKESSDNKNPKYSEAFMELIAIQKPVQEELNVPTESNKSTEVPVDKEAIDVAAYQLISDDDTHISSIPSINVSDEVKHPLFRPKARKSLYSMKQEQKFVEQCEEQNIKKISKKRMSLRSSSPADSGISKFFDESLISSTKLLINPNGEKSGGSDESAKKKRATKLRKISSKRGKQYSGSVPENSENVNNTNRNYDIKISMPNTEINEIDQNPCKTINEPPENLLTPKSINEIEQKNFMSKIPRKLSSLSNAPERTSAPESIKLKNISFEALEGSSSFENNEDEDHSEIMLTPVANLNIKRKRLKNKSKSTINKEFQSSQNNIISIRSSDINERSNRTEQIKNWLSTSVMANNAQSEEIQYEKEYILNNDLNPSFRKSNILSAKRDTDASLSEEEILQRMKILKTTKVLPKELKTSPLKVHTRKMTDFFNKLDKNEKLKPIPKNTKIVKKVSRPVCTARLIDGKPYYTKKLFAPERWCSQRFYKYLQNKMKDKYEKDTINESENLMKYIVQHVKSVIKSKKYLKEEVDKFKIELAEKNIISTNYDFSCFCFDYLPIEYQILVVPITQAFTSKPTVPYKEEDVFKKIIV